MIVATTIMGIAVVGLMAGISSSTRNAARLQDYDRAVQLARVRMNELLVDPRLPRNVPREGVFDPRTHRRPRSGWRARVTVVEKCRRRRRPGEYVLDRLELEIWWMSGGQRRTFTLDAYRRRTLRPEDFVRGVLR